MSERLGRSSTGSPPGITIYSIARRTSCQKQSEKELHFQQLQEISCAIFAKLNGMCTSKATSQDKMRDYDEGLMKLINLEKRGLRKKEEEGHGI